MFAARLSRISSRIGVRIALYQAIVFVLSTCLLFASAYWTLTTYLTKKDHELIQSKLDTLSIQYERKGIQGLRQSIDSQGVEDEIWIFARFESPDGKVQILKVPKDSTHFPLDRLSSSASKQSQPSAWIKIEKAGEENALEILSKRLRDGSIFQIGRNTDDREDEIEVVQKIFLGLVVPIVLLAILGGYFLSSRALKPIRGMIESIRKISRGDLSVRLNSTTSDDELAELSRTFNQMAERVHSLIQGMRRTVDDVAHDLRTPLTRFRGSAERALQAEADLDLYREALLECLDASDRILTLVDAVMDIAEAKSGSLKLECKPVALRALASEITELYDAVAEEAGIQLINRIPEGITLWADPRHVARALGNLVDNAIKYGKPEGKVTLLAEIAGAEIFIHVSDDGIGIPEEELPRIWTRLYRVDQSRSKKGLGLGLTLVKAIAEAHQGKVSVKSALEQGSVFTIAFPAPV